MSELHILVANAPLREAILEQLKAALPADVRVVESIQAPATAEPVAILFDADNTDHKALKKIGEQREKEQRLKIFLLGDRKPEFIDDKNETLLVEVFTKPLRLGYLLARLQFYFQTPHLQGVPLRFAFFRLEPNARQAAIEDNGLVVRLTEKETQLLEYLGRSEQPVPRDELLAAIWGYDARIDTHTLETHIYRLRRKLDPDGRSDTFLAAQNGCYSLKPVKP